MIFFKLYFELNKKNQSLNSVVDFDLITLEDKKSFVQDCINKQFDVNAGPLRILCRAFFQPILSNLGSIVVQRIVIPKLLARIDVDNVATLLKGKMTLNQVCDVIVVCIEF